MATELSEKIRGLFNDPKSIKILATISKEGEVHAVAKGSLRINEQGDIVYYELLESSRTNRNMIYSLWFDKKVAINVIGANGESFQLKGIPYKTLVSGKEYEKAYVKAQERNPENDLAAVYFIKVDEITEQTYLVRKEQEETKHPLYIHLDRLAK